MVLEFLTIVSRFRKFAHRAFSLFTSHLNVWKYVIHRYPFLKYEWPYVIHSVESVHEMVISLPVFRTLLVGIHHSTIQLPWKMSEWPYVGSIVVMVKNENAPSDQKRNPPFLFSFEMLSCRSDSAREHGYWRDTDHSLFLALTNPKMTRVWEFVSHSVFVTRFCRCFGGLLLFSV